MSTKAFVLATIAGGIALFAAGGVIYGWATTGFFEANQGTALNVMRDPPDFFHLFLGQLVFGALLTVIIGKWAGQTGVGAGLRIGAIAGLLFGFGIDLTMFATSNIMNATAMLVDPFFFMAVMAVGGGVVGLVLAKVK